MGAALRPARAAAPVGPLLAARRPHATWLDEVCAAKFRTRALNSLNHPARGFFFVVHIIFGATIRAASIALGGQSKQIPRSRNCTCQGAPRGHLTGSRLAAVEPVDMMRSRLSGKRPDLMSKEHAEHASLKLAQAAETNEKWTLASGDKKT